jgi:hypothetical protein
VAICTRGTAPLHTAAEYGSKQVALLLLRLGADAHARDASGRSPLDVAKTGGVDGDVNVKAALQAALSGFGALLARLSLSQFEPALRELGAECTESAALLADEDLSDVADAAGDKMKPLQRRKLLAALASPPADRKRAFEATPAEAPPTRPAPGAKQPPPCAVMISYRVPETGNGAGGDGSVFALQRALVARGYSVFVGEGSIRPGDEWPLVIQQGVDNCKAFIALCSASYGDGAVSKWTRQEYHLADNEKKVMLHVWHSGAWPPPAIKISTSLLQRIPAGDYRKGFVAAGIALEVVVAELVDALVRNGIQPDLAPAGRPQ